MPNERLIFRGNSPAVRRAWEDENWRPERPLRKHENTGQRLLGFTNQLSQAQELAKIIESESELSKLAEKIGNTVPR